MDVVRQRMQADGINIRGYVGWEEGVVEDDNGCNSAKEKVRDEALQEIDNLL